MSKKIFFEFLSIVLVLSLLPTACGVKTGNNIATVESIQYHLAWVGDDGVSVNLKPSSGATANKLYTVDLYESGRFIASQTVSWNDSELQVSTLKKLMFSLPYEELQAYMGSGKDSNDVFSVKIHEPVSPSTTSISKTPKQNPTVSFNDAIVNFHDANLEAVIRQAINKPTGDIYRSNLQALTELDANHSNISNIRALLYCINLTTLYLNNNQISDISDLSWLTNLRTLYLSGNQISNIVSLISLTNLKDLQLDHNQIIDISPLASLTNLKMLQLDYNQITNISTLLINFGLSSAGAHIYLRGNPLSVTSLNTYIPQLRSRGVLVDLSE